MVTTLDRGVQAGYTRSMASTSTDCPACAASTLGVCNDHPFDAKAYAATLDAEDAATLRIERRRGWTPTR